MGCQFQFGVVSENAQRANHWLEEGIREISRLETLLSEFDQNSYTSKVNDAAGSEFVEVPVEVFKLIERSVHISRLTKGHFDISVGPLKQLYKFKNDEFQLPKRRIIGKALQQIGYNNILLNSEEKSVKLRKPGMKISFAAIGKGYAADVVLAKWKANDVQGGFVNASGDLTAFGLNEKDEAWTVGISNPDDRSKPLFYVPQDGTTNTRYKKCVRVFSKCGTFGCLSDWYLCYGRCKRIGVCKCATKHSLHYN